MFAVKATSSSYHQVKFMMLFNNHQVMIILYHRAEFIERNKTVEIMGSSIEHHCFVNVKNKIG